MMKQLAMVQSIFDSSWFNICFVVILFLFIGTGILYAFYYKKKNKWESTGIENSVIGIFGLIISFTFLQSANIHRERLINIHKQANSINMLHRYSQEMPDSFSRKTRSFLLAFLDNQLTYKKQSNDARFLFNAKEIVDSYWADLEDYRKQNTNQNNTGHLNKIYEYFEQIQSSFVLNNYSYIERTPALIMILLVTVSLLIGFFVGFLNGIKSNVHFLVPLIYFVMISLTMVVIIDLNSPLQGFIQPNYDHLRITYEYIKNN